jgi:hypothetical protein
MKICLLLSERKAPKEYKKYMKQVINTDPALKEHIIDTYMYRQNMHGKIRFMEWYIDDQDKLLQTDQIADFNFKYANYKTVLPWFQSIVSFIDLYLDQGVKNLKFLNPEEDERKKKIVVRGPTYDLNSVMKKTRQDSL